MKERSVSLAASVDSEAQAIPKEAPAVIQNAISEIIAFGGLSDNWDSYNGKAPSEDTLYAAACLVSGVFDAYTPVPSIFPVANGNIQIEWSLDNKEIEVEIKSLSECTLYYSNLSTLVEYEKTLDYNLEALREVIAELGNAAPHPNLRLVNG